MVHEKPEESEAPKKPGIKSRLLIFFVPTIIVFSLFGLLLYWTGILRFGYPSLDEFPIRGIDISHHQGKINWRDLKGEEISFVFMKATEGGDYKDENFTEYLAQARASGYAVGAYHFFRLCKTGDEQARNFTAAVPPGHYILPIVDLEEEGNCITGQSHQKILAEFKIYVDTITKNYGRPPVIYVTHGFYDLYIKGNFPQCPIWIRSIDEEPKLSDNREWMFWQYSAEGNLNGIEGDVDLNVFRGDSINW
ncbi:MAG TPA: GH25 family lysozyme [Bacteroidia bacterium]|nr:GH25 family lysozyme [Bacteroidia bacterium]